VVQGLLEDLVDRGLDRQRRYLVVIDGSKALRAGVERVFGEQVEVQRCQIHKRRNVKEYLPENCQKDYDRRMRNAYAMNNYAEAKEALQKIFRQLERINLSAARSLEEGLEETLTVHRLGTRCRATLPRAAPRIKIFLLCGKTPTLISPSQSKPRPNTRSCSSSVTGLENVGFCARSTAQPLFPANQSTAAINLDTSFTYKRRAEPLANKENYCELQITR
jgi:hypothetical protein